MKVKDVRASVHSFPVTIPLLRQPIEHRKVVFCQVETDDGYAGYGLTGHFLPFAVEVALNAVDILQPNCCYNGGYTETRKVAHLAQVYNLPIANGGGWPLFNMHTMAGLMNGWRVEFHLGMQQVGERIFVDPPQPEDQMVRIPKAPGLGLTPNFDVLGESRLTE